MKLHDSTIEGGNAYPLPPGWHHGDEVTVIGFDHGYVRVLGDGKETTVFIVNIDSGWDEWVDGKWRERRRMNSGAHKAANDENTTDD